MLQILRFLGWDYVSLVVSSDDAESMAGAEAFRTVAQASRICVALDLKMAPLDPQAAATLADQVRCTGMQVNRWESVIQTDC